VSDLYQRKAVLVLGADLALEHPLLSFQIRANYRSSPGAHLRRDAGPRARRQILRGEHTGWQAGEETDAAGAGPRFEVATGPSIAAGNPSGFFHPHSRRPLPRTTSRR